MTRDIEGELLQKRAIKSAKMSNEELIDEAKKIFSRRKMVWIGGLQMALQLPVDRACFILEQLIIEGFAIPRNKKPPRIAAYVSIWKKRMRNLK